jgi:hypothetical protein
MSPTAEILSNAAQTIVVTDDIGRQLTIRLLTALDTLRLFKAAGPVLSQNQSWLSVASLAISVTSIDGLPIPAPANEAQIEAIVGRLADVGLAAIAAALDTQNSPSISALSDSAGNLPGTPT